MSALFSTSSGLIASMLTTVPGEKLPTVPLGKTTDPTALPSESVIGTRSERDGIGGLDRALDSVGVADSGGDDKIELEEEAVPEELPRISEMEGVLLFDSEARLVGRTANERLAEAVSVVEGAFDTEIDPDGVAVSVVEELSNIDSVTDDEVDALSELEEVAD